MAKWHCCGKCSLLTRNQDSANCPESAKNNSAKDVDVVINGVGGGVVGDWNWIMCSSSTVSQIIGVGWNWIKMSCLHLTTFSSYPPMLASLEPLHHRSREATEGCVLALLNCIDPFLSHIEDDARPGK